MKLCLRHEWLAYSNETGETTWLPLQKMRLVSLLNSKVGILKVVQGDLMYLFLILGLTYVFYMSKTSFLAGF